MNAVSFVLLSGNIITLFSLRLGAGSLLVGIISSITYISYIAIFLGRHMIKKLGAVRLMGRYWLLRYILMVPILTSPLFVQKDLRLTAYIIIVLCVLGFSISRGIAITDYNPILGEITSEKNRGRFLASLQVVNHSSTLILGIAIALLLGKTAPFYVCQLFIASGIAFGIFATFIFLRLPEPESIQEGVMENILSGFRNAIRQQPLRKFTLVQFLLSFATLMITPFLIVYMKTVYDQPDNFIVFFTVFGSLGGIIMALVSGFFIDCLGAKPLYFIFSGIVALTLLPMIISPGLDSKSVIFFSIFIFFLNNLSNFGIITAGQTYFLKAINPGDRLNLGAVYYLLEGLGGGLGALTGGIILNQLQQHTGLGFPGVYRVYFFILTVFFAVILVLISRMERLGAYTIGNTLGIIFSPRDLRAINLLNRLGKTTSMSEEKRVIQALAASQSELSIGEILIKLKSPRFSVRIEALSALSKLPSDIRELPVLIREVKNRVFTSAHIAAQIIGKKNYIEGTGILRKRLHSQDYHLSGECMVALARLGDRYSMPEIRDIIEKTTNPRLIIHGASALEIFRDVYAIPVLFNKLERKISPFIRDEIILSLAGILGIEKWFYPLYIQFLEKATAGISMLKDKINSFDQIILLPKHISRLLDLLPKKDRLEFVECALEILLKIRIDAGGKNVSEYFSDALKNSNLSRLDRLCFLTAAVIVGNSTIKW